MKPIKKSAKILFLSFLFFSATLFLFSSADAGQLSPIKDRLNRQRQNLTSGIVHTLVFTTEQAVSGGAGNNQIKIDFPATDSGLWCRTPGALVVNSCTEDGANPLPGTLLASCSQSNDRITIAGVDNLLAGTQYCVQVEDTTTGDLGTPTSSTKGQITVTTNDGIGNIDSETFAVDIVTNDEVTVTANVSSASGDTGVGGGSGGGATIPQAEIIFLGWSKPNSQISVIKDGQIVTTTIANQDGYFQASIKNIAGGTYAFLFLAKDEQGTLFGSHSVSVVVSTGVITTISGIVIDQYIPPEGDLNSDGRVSIVDLSIMIYWMDRTDFPAIVDLNLDGRVDIVDVSILAYYWTG